MPSGLVELCPKKTPDAYYLSRCMQNYDRETQIDVTRAGLRIIFSSENGKHFVLAGQFSLEHELAEEKVEKEEKLYIENESKIDRPRDTFLHLLASTLAEETFGMLWLSETPTAYKLTVRDDEQDYPLIMKTSLSHLSTRNAYVTFTAICQGFTQEKLQAIAAAMNPTAQIWNLLGEHLFIRPLKREDLILRLQSQYNTLTEDLEHPTKFFEVRSVEELVDTLNQKNKLDLEIVKSCSKRQTYHVVNINELLLAAQIERPACDINGNPIAPLHYPDIVKEVISAFIFESPELQQASTQLLSLSFDDLHKFFMLFIMQFGSLQNALRNPKYKLQLQFMHDVLNDKAICERFSKENRDEFSKFINSMLEQTNKLLMPDPPKTPASKPPDQKLTIEDRLIMTSGHVMDFATEISRLQEDMIEETLKAFIKCEDKRSTPNNLYKQIRYALQEYSAIKLQRKHLLLACACIYYYDKKLELKSLDSSNLFADSIKKELESIRVLMVCVFGHKKPPLEQFTNLQEGSLKIMWDCCRQECMELAPQETAASPPQYHYQTVALSKLTSQL